jgi:hypothetical protein
MYYGNCCDNEDVSENVCLVLLQRLTLTFGVLRARPEKKRESYMSRIEVEKGIICENAQ